MRPSQLRRPPPSSHLGLALTRASASAMALRLRSGVSGMPSPSFVVAGDARLRDTELLRRGVGEVLPHSDTAATTRSAGVHLRVDVLRGGGTARRAIFPSAGEELCRPRQRGVGDRCREHDDAADEASCRRARSRRLRALGGNRRNAKTVTRLRLATTRIPRPWTERTLGLGNGPPTGLTTRGSSPWQEGRPFHGRRAGLGEGTSMTLDRGSGRARRAQSDGRARAARRAAVHRRGAFRTPVQFG